MTDKPGPNGGTQRFWDAYVRVVTPAVLGALIAWAVFIHASAADDRVRLSVLRAEVDALERSNASIRRYLQGLDGRVRSLEAKIDKEPPR